MAAAEGNLRAQIEDYAKRVRKGLVGCELPACSRCAAKRFWRNGVRERKFLVICKNFVQTVLGCLSLWKCRKCGKSFTLYTDFAFPHKRYSRHSIMELTQRYVENDKLTYRKAVLQEGMAFGYGDDSEEDEPIDERQLAHSTLYHWITTVGGFTDIVRKAQDLITQKNPASSICRELAALTVAPNKWIKPAREAVLKRCRHIGHLDRRYEATFEVSIFPYFATACAWS